MKVSIPIEHQNQGGGFYFLKALSEYLVERGWSVTRDLREGASLLLVNSWQVPREKVLAAVWRNPKVRIIHRIDGSACDYGRHGNADEEMRKVSRLADVTIFQSHYARYATCEKFPIVMGDGPVIHNAVDVRLFSPEGPRRKIPGSVRVACVTWSTNPLKGAASIYKVASLHPDTTFILCGNYPDAPDLPNLHHLGVLDRKALAETLRSCHVLLTFSRNEACPNHVLEALASGLPVLYDESGATGELVEDCGLPVTVETFGKALERAIAEREVLSVKAMERVMSAFHPDRIFPLYMQVMEKALRDRTSLSPAYRSWLAWSTRFSTGSRRLAAPIRRRFR